MRTLILGAGAIGGFFGGHLARVGHDVTFLARPARAAVLRRTGLQIRSQLGSFATKVAVIENGDAVWPFDAVLLSCKAYDLEQAVASIEPTLGPQTIVIPLLNGTRHLEALSHRLPLARICGGLSHLSSTLASDGVIEHSTPHAVIRVGSLHARDEVLVYERLRTLIDAWQNAGLDASISEDILTEMWAKHIFIAALAAATCLMRASVGAILQIDGGDDFMRRLFDEAVAVGTSMAPGVGTKHLEGYNAMLFEAGSPVKASMARDIDSGRPTEVDHIIGDLVRCGTEQGVATPLMSLALLNLRAYDATRTATIT